MPESQTGGREPGANGGTPARSPARILIVGDRPAGHVVIEALLREFPGAVIEQADSGAEDARETPEASLQALAEIAGRVTFTALAEHEGAARWAALTGAEIPPAPDTAALVRQAYRDAGTSRFRRRR